MLRNRAWHIVIGSVFVFLVGIQFVPIVRDNPPSPSLLQAPEKVTAVLTKACYDCHSHETQWPWYSHVAPVSWLVAYDVRAGREHLNFSTWNNLPAGRQQRTREGIRDMVEKGEMPMKIYIWMHRQASLTDADKQVLYAWCDKDQEF